MTNALQDSLSSQRQESAQSVLSGMPPVRTIVVTRKCLSALPVYLCRQLMQQWTGRSRSFFWRGGIYAETSRYFSLHHHRNRGNCGFHRAAAEKRGDTGFRQCRDQQRYARGG